MGISFDSKIYYLDKLRLHYVIVSEEILLKLRPDNFTGSLYNQRVRIQINGKLGWQGGTVSLGNKCAYITLSLARMKQLSVTLGDNVHVTLKPDNTEFGFDVPVELEEVLRQDSEAKRRFDQLKPGFKRHIIYLIQNYKTSQTRIDKSIFYLENLKRSPEGNTTMRQIYGKDLP